MKTLRDPARDVPIVFEADLCVLGGSCTGVCAAVAAARMGLKVAIVEQNGFFGGVATAAMVNIWHSMLSTDGSLTTIAGLTREILDRLVELDAVDIKDPLVWYGSFFLNTQVLKIVLDQMVVEAGIRPFLHTRFCVPHLENGKPVAAILEDKGGRRAIGARFFIDATGDGDFIHRCGLPTRQPTHLQPPTTCMILRGMQQVSGEFPQYAKNTFPGINLSSVLFDPTREDSLRKGFAWWTQVPGSSDETLLAATRVFGADCADPDQLTEAEIEGRRQAMQIIAILRQRLMAGRGQPLVTLASHIGVRETRHAVCMHQLTEKELLGGARFPDAIANGTYPIDIHHTDREGIVLRMLNGKQLEISATEGVKETRWLEAGQTATTFYQIPYRSLVPKGASNVLVAGRLVDADPGAYGAIRVMVNCNQTGQAAGVACALASRSQTPIGEIDVELLRTCLREQGAAVL